MTIFHPHTLSALEEEGKQRCSRSFLVAAPHPIPSPEQTRLGAAAEDAWVVDPGWVKGVAGGREVTYLLCAPSPASPWGLQGPSFLPSAAQDRWGAAQTPPG